MNTFFQERQVLCDPMAGVGPLAIKSAVKIPGFRVVCNDLNPLALGNCYRNMKLNEVKRRVSGFNMDARKFIKFYIDQSNMNHNALIIPSDRLRFDHCVMNLPKTSIEMLDVFNGLFKSANPNVWCRNPNDPQSLRLPMIHVYGFTSLQDRNMVRKYFADRIGTAMQMEPGAFMPEQIIDLHYVRDVSTNSHMYATSFRLPYEVAMGIKEMPRPAP